MKKAGHTIAHVFDPLHLLKNMRNNLWNNVVSKWNGSEAVKFNLNTLDDLLQLEHDIETRQKFKKLHPTSPFPKDKMDLSPIRFLLSEPLIVGLEEQSRPAAKYLGEYLKHMRFFDRATTDDEMDNDARFSALNNVLAYFKTLGG